MPVTFVEIFAIILLVIANGFLAMAEIAIVSARRARLQQRADEGDKGAKMVLTLKEHPTGFLSTVQIGITLVGVLSGAFAGATVAEELEGVFKTISAIAPYAEVLSVAIVVCCVTYLSLIIGELVPKRLAIDNAELIACAVAGPMLVLSRLASPIVKVLTASTDLVLSVFGKQSVAESPVSEEEINVLIEEGTKAGVFMPSEQEMVAEVLKLSDRTVSEIMTPRKQVTWLDIQKSLEENLRKVMTSIHNSYPVADATLDHVLGIVNAKDLLVRKTLGQTFDLAGCMHHALVVPENKTAMAALELFRESGNHTALVVDEYGTMLGIITVYDIIEAIVGELPTAGGKPRWQATQREDGSWLIDGMAPVDEFKEMFEIKHLPGEEAGLYHTLGGFVTHELEHIPAEAEHFEWSGLRFEIVDMDRYRVDKILVSHISAREEAEPTQETEGTEPSSR